MSSCNGGSLYFIISSRFNVAYTKSIPIVGEWGRREEEREGEGEEEREEDKIAA
jgi:hypothetical protein